MIIEINNPILIPQILDLAKKIDKIQAGSLKAMLIDGISRNDSRILIEKKDGEIRGFLFATIETFNGEDAVFIQACHIEPDAPQAGHEMLKKMKQWGKELGLKTIYFWSYRDPAGFQRKYNFELAGHILKRGI